MTAPRLYGKIARNKDRQWIVQCEPQVTIKFKRLFEKINKASYGVMIIKDNREACRDILWMLERYPLEISAYDLRYLRARAAEHRRLEQDVCNISSDGYTPREYELALPPREYQRVAADLLLRRDSLLLADDLGLGKSVSAICVLVAPDALPALIVVPKHLQRQWQREINRFAPGLSTHIIKSGKVYDLTKVARRTVPFPDVIICTYMKLVGWADTLAGVAKTVVWDEVQDLRHSGTAKYDASNFVAKKAERRLGLSATPVHNFGGEIWTVLNVISPGELGEFDEFTREWCRSEAGYGGTSKAIIKEPKAFGHYLREQGLMLRRTRAEVGRELPPLTKIIQTIETDTKPIDDVRSAAAELARIILKQGGSGLDKMRAAKELDWRLRQATGIAKCLAPGTRVLKFDGTTEVVEKLVIGDQLMGPDSRPRRILATTSGRGEMYEVSSTARIPLFQPYIVNGEHILALKHSGAIRYADRGLFGPYVRGEHLEIPVKEYIKKSKHFKRMLKGFKSAVDFKETPVPLDPYFLGLWLGDGHSGTASVTTADTEIVDYLYEVAERYGLKISVGQPARTAPTYRLTVTHRGDTSCRYGNGRNRLRTTLNDLGVLANKHIPDTYLINSRNVRMQLLAGLLDSDGHFNCPGVYTISTQWRHLGEQICRLAASLGFASKLQRRMVSNQTGKSFVAYCLCIYGNGLEYLPIKIPRKKSPPRRQIKDPLRSAVDVTPVGLGEFYGFELEGDGLFLLSDFTVTHNSPYVADFVRMLVENGEPVILAGWHRECYAIWLERLKDLNPVMYTGSESLPEKERSREAFMKGDAQVIIISLRSGSGLDGLQQRTRTIVHGELDWSPACHEQLDGRAHRDGQTMPVTAFYLLAEDGSDPVISDCLGLKRQQLEGIRDPDAAPVVGATDPNRVRKLAEAFLEQQGQRRERDEEAA